MGLDITAYNHLTYVGHHRKWADEDKHYDEHHEAYAYDSFPHALLGVPNVQTKSGYGGSTFLSGGCFQVTDKTKAHEFRAGSYSGYNAWRRDLAEQFNPYGPGAGTGGLGDYIAPDPEKPFYELIWFADNAGTICELAAANLLPETIGIVGAANWERLVDTDQMTILESLTNPSGPATPPPLPKPPRPAVPPKQTYRLTLRGRWRRLPSEVRGLVWLALAVTAVGAGMWQVIP